MEFSSPDIATPGLSSPKVGDFCRVITNTSSYRHNTICRIVSHESIGVPSFPGSEDKIWTKHINSLGAYWTSKERFNEVFVLISLSELEKALYAL